MVVSGRGNVPCVLIARMFCFFLLLVTSRALLSPTYSGHTCHREPQAGCLPAEAWLPATSLRAASPKLQATSVSSLRSRAPPHLDSWPATSQGTVWGVRNVLCSHGTAFTGILWLLLTSHAPPAPDALPLGKVTSRLPNGGCCPVLAWLEL